MTFYGPEYRVAFYDKSGDPVEYFKDFLSLTVDSLWCNKGSYQITISGFDDRTEKISEDDLLVVSLIDPNAGITSWVDIFTGFVKTPVSSLSQGGKRSFQSFGPSLEELLAKEYILWYSGSSQATKSGTAEAMMVEFVNENIGSLALASSGRDADGVVAGLTAISSGVGPAWSGSKARKPLLSTLRDMRAYSIEQDNQIDFRITHTGNYNFLFECGPLGVDRTTVGLDPTTGLNAAGNTPIVFSEGSKNIESFTRSRPSTNTISQVVALGSGDLINRKTAVAVDAAALAISPIARRTKTITVNSDDDDVLLASATAKLSELKPRDNFFFQPKDTRSVFNLDYFLGDFITAQDRGDEFHKQVVGAHYSLNKGTSTIVSRTLDFSDI